MITALQKMMDLMRHKLHISKIQEVAVSLVTLKFLADNGFGAKATWKATTADLMEFAMDCEETLNLSGCFFTSRLALVDNLELLMGMLQDVSLKDEENTGWVADAVGELLAQGRGRDIVSTTPSIALLMAKLGIRAQTKTVADLFVGTGQNLSQVRKILPDAMVYGQDLVEEPLYYSVILQLLQQSTKFQFSVSNTLEKPVTTAFDLIVSAPPMGLSMDSKNCNPNCFVYPELLSRRGDLAMVQNALVNLREGGTAVLQLPMGPMFQTGRVANARMHLVESGHIQAVVQLPSGCALGTNVPTCLVVITPQQKRDHVLLLDGSSADCTKYFDIRQRRATTISQEGIEAICQMVQEERELSAVCQKIPLETIRKEGYMLTPQAYLEPQEEPTQIWGSVAEHRQKQAVLYQQLEVCRRKLDAILEGEADAEWCKK